MPATTSADSAATLRFLAELGVTGWRCMSQGSQRHVSTQPDDGGDKEEDNEPQEDPRERDGALAAAAHVLGRKRLLVHDLAHPPAGAQGDTPRARSEMMAAK